MSEQVLSGWEEKEDMEQAKITAELIAADGLGYGYGSISGAEAEPAEKSVLHEVITTDPNIIVPVDREDDGSQLDDDGCGDGRDVGVIQRGVRLLRRSLNRSKVFGGALAMTVASKIGLGTAESSSLNDVYEQSITTLNEHGIDFGAHTAEHHAANGCGCGAIDGTPEIIQAVATYEMQIKDTIEGLGIDSTGLDEVVNNFKTYGKSLDAAAFSGRRVMDSIVRAGKVIKQLVGGHLERVIVLNTVRGYTVNQALIRQATDEKAQAFGVDLWRMQDIAQRTYDEPQTAQRAFLSELVYTLATAAVLTKGDLPVYLIRAEA